MNALRRQQIFERLRSRFGTAGNAGFDPKSRPARQESGFPTAMLKTGLHECLGQGPGDWPSALGFALLAAGRVPQTGRFVFFLNLKNSSQELGELYGHGVAASGLDAAHLVTITVKGEKELLWAAEEVIASQAARAVIVALDAREKLYGFMASRRLKLRSETSRAPIFVLRHWQQGGATAAHARWRIARRPSTSEIKTPGAELVGAPRVSAHLERCQGAPPSSWEIGIHASHSSGVASLLADRAPRAGGASRQAA